MSLFLPRGTPSDEFLLKSLINAELKTISAHTSEIEQLTSRHCGGEPFSFIRYPADNPNKPRLSITLHSSFAYRLPIIHTQFLLSSARFVIAFSKEIHLYNMALIGSPVVIQPPQPDVELQQVAPVRLDNGFLALTDSGLVYPYSVSRKQWGVPLLFSQPSPVRFLSAVDTHFVVAIADNLLDVCDSRTFQVVFSYAPPCGRIISAQLCGHGGLWVAVLDGRYQIRLHNFQAPNSDQIILVNGPGALEVAPNLECLLFTTSGKVDVFLRPTERGDHRTISSDAMVCKCVMNWAVSIAQIEGRARLLFYGMPGMEPIAMLTLEKGGFVWVEIMSGPFEDDVHILTGVSNGQILLWTLVLKVEGGMQMVPMAEPPPMTRGRGSKGPRKPGARPPPSARRPGRPPFPLPGEIGRPRPHKEARRVAAKLVVPGADDGTGPKRPEDDRRPPEPFEE
jgi:hypothetical protein